MAKKTIIKRSTMMRIVKTTSTGPAKVPPRKNTAWIVWDQNDQGQDDRNDVAPAFPPPGAVDCDDVEGIEHGKVDPGPRVLLEKRANHPDHRCQIE